MFSTCSRRFCNRLKKRQDSSNTFSFSHWTTFSYLCCLLLPRIASWGRNWKEWLAREKEKLFCDQKVWCIIDRIAEPETVHFSSEIDHYFCRGRLWRIAVWKRDNVGLQYLCHSHDWCPLIISDKEFVLSRKYGRQFEFYSLHQTNSREMCSRCSIRLFIQCKRKIG